MAPLLTALRAAFFALRPQDQHGIFRWNLQHEVPCSAVPSARAGAARGRHEDEHLNASNHPGGDAPNVLDMRVIEGLRELGGTEDPGLLVEVIGMFLEDAPARLRELQLGFETKDIRLLERAAHSLKSASANVGATGLSDLCKRMEESARQRRSEGIAELLTESTRIWAEVEVALRSIRG